MDGGRERQPHVHAAGVFLHRARDELADFGEALDGGHGPVDFGAAQAHDFAVEVDVFAAGEFGVEAGAELEQGGDAAARDDAAGGGLQDAADDLEERALAASIGADEAEGLTLLELEADIAQGPKIGMPRAGTGQQLAQPVCRAAVQTIQLGDVLNEDQI